jgi:hypothetical protein
MLMIDLPINGLLDRIFWAWASKLEGVAWLGSSQFGRIPEWKHCQKSNDDKTTKARVLGSSRRLFRCMVFGVGSSARGLLTSTIIRVDVVGMTKFASFNDS